MTHSPTPGPAGAPGFWLQTAEHRAFLMADARRQFDFFAASARPGPGFCTLDHAGQPLPDDLQELHTTTRLVHSYALGIASGIPGAGEIVDQGMDYLWSHHRDTLHGGYVWGMAGDRVADGGVTDADGAGQFRIIGGTTPEGETSPLLLAGALVVLGATALT